MRQSGWLLGVLIPLFAACGGTTVASPANGGAPNCPAGQSCSGTGGGNTDIPLEPGAPVTLGLSSAEQAVLTEVQSELLPDLSTADFETRYAPTYASSLGYDPSTAAGLDLIAASPLALDASEQAKLDANGFVISTRQQYPSFVYGYQAIYMADLPVFVSADSILDAVHRSYDEILEQVEQGLLIDDLSAMLSAMRGNLSSIADATARADCDFYLTVAASLLDGQALAPSDGGDATAVSTFFDNAQSASGTGDVTLFGVQRTVDFSQFKPRGHYTDSPDLEAYFRAMMWLGRIDFRLIETQSDGSQVFRRRQFDAMLGLHGLMDAGAEERWSRVDSIVRAFVGESDYMTVPEVDSLVSDLGGSDAVASKTDGQIAQAIVDGGYGQQLIASHIIIKDNESTLPLNASFALFGQRYVIDSHVLSNVVWDRTQAMRMMPDPLDVAFAALDNDQAGELLQPELESYDYAPNLHAMRVVAEQHDASFWDANLYNVWLSSLRALSGGHDRSDPAAAGMPLITGTEPWGRRMLNAQLGSWAELRHDTILYAKQSYTGGASCEFPDAYVEPYPEFFAALGRFADHGTAIAGIVQSAGATELAQRIQDYFAAFSSVVSTLEQMAEAERTGTPFTADQLAFINESVGLSQAGCVSDGSTGWYSRLFFDNWSSDDYDPTIADVHTQPTDEAGNPVGRILHVGTGRPRLMVLTTNNCSGPRAYTGLVFSYYEKVTDNFERLDDPSWSSMLDTTPPPADVPWVESLLAN